jgi:hypothetical protein
VRVNSSKRQKYRIRSSPANSPAQHATQRLNSAAIVSCVAHSGRVSAPHTYAATEWSSLIQSNTSGSIHRSYAIQE